MGRAVAVSLALGALIGGCGASDQENVRATVDAFVGAIERGDFAAACDEIAPDARGAVIDDFLPGNVAYASSEAARCEISLRSFADRLGRARLGQLQSAARGLGTSVHSRTGAVETPHSALAVQDRDGDWQIIKIELFAPTVGPQRY